MNHLIKIVLTTLPLLSSAIIFAQQKRADSLITKLNASVSDTQKVNLLNALFWEFSNNNSDSALKIAQLAMRLSEKSNYAHGKIASGNNIGTAYLHLAQYPVAIRYFIHCANQLEVNKSKSLADQKMLSSAYNNIGVIYLNQQQFIMAAHYFKKAVVIDLLIDDKKGLANCYNNLGIVSNESGKQEEAIKYYNQSLKIKYILNDSAGIPSTLINLGVIAMAQQKFDDAENQFTKAHEMATRVNDKMDQALALINHGDVCYWKKEWERAISFYKRGEEVCREEKYFQYLSYVLQSLGLAHAKLKIFDQAYAYYGHYASIKDSIYNRDNSKIVNELAAKYESESKEKEIRLLTSEKEVQELELNKKKMLIYASTAGMVLFALIVIIGIYAFRQKQNTNRELDLKNKKIELAYSVIEEKNKEIVDSIQYAKRIQNSLMTSEKYISKNIERLNKRG